MYVVFFFFKQKTAYEMRISDRSSDVCSSDLISCDGKREWVKYAYRASNDLECRSEVPILIAVFTCNDCKQTWTDQQSEAIRAAAVSEAIQIGRASCRERVCQYV